MKLKSVKEDIHNNVPEGTDEVVNVIDIIIPEEFKKTKCGYNKIRWAEEYYIRNRKFDKPISVVAETNERGESNKLYLVNEYSRLLAAQNLWISYVPIKYIAIDNNEQ